MPSSRFPLSWLTNCLHRRLHLHLFLSLASFVVKYFFFVSFFNVFPKFTFFFFAHLPQSSLLELFSNPHNHLLQIAQRFQTVSLLIISIINICTFSLAVWHIMPLVQFLCSLPACLRESILSQSEFNSSFNFFYPVRILVYSLAGAYIFPYMSPR